MPFFVFSNLNREFSVKKLIWKLYTIFKILSIVQKLERISKHKFAEIVLDKNTNIFITHVTTLEAPE